MGNNTQNSQDLLRTILWQKELEEILHEDLLGMAFVRQIEFPDGLSFNMPSIGTPLVRDFPEGSEVTFDALDNGSVTVVMNAPVIAANSVTEVQLEDSMWANELLSAIPVEQGIAIMERFETDTLALCMQQQGGINDLNLINGVAHRKIGQGTNEVMDVKDFAFAGYALQKAKVGRKNLVAIVDPSVAYTLETLTNLTNVSNNPKWEGIIASGISKDHRFIRNIFGFDVFESMMLPTANETIDGKTTTAGVANQFMSLARPQILPYTLAWRRHPKLRGGENSGTHDIEVETTARWGTGLTRDENLVVIITDIDQVT